MKNLQVGELKSKFSKVLEDIKKGEEITISFGKKKEKIAVIMPYTKYKKKYPPEAWNPGKEGVIRN